MKITVEIDASPQEVRDFFGLPDIQSLQNEILQKLRDDMANGIPGFDPLSLLKPVLPAHMQSMETMQNAFWNAFTTSKPADENSDKSDT